MPTRQPIDPTLRQFLDEQAENAPAFASMSDPERTSAHRDAMMRALNSRDGIPGLPNAVDARDVELKQGLFARLYRPAHSLDPLPVLVYLHGGGWVAGSIATHDPFCRLLAEAAGLSILSVDYRQPPHDRFPAAVDDGLAAVHCAAKRAAEWNINPQRLALGGDSAGGNLAAVVANRLLSESNAPSVAALLLLFPVTDHLSANHSSWKENATGFGLTAEGMTWYWRQYAPDTEDPNNPDLSPLRRKDLPPLPPTLVTTAEYDLLRDEGVAYVQKLNAAGVITTHLHAPDMHHNFFISPATVARFPQCQTTLNEVAGWLRATLHTPLPARH